MGEGFGYVIGVIRHYMPFRLGSMGLGSHSCGVAWVNLGSGLYVAFAACRVQDEFNQIFGQSQQKLQ